MYHSMVVLLGLYMGPGPINGVSIRSFKGTMGLLALAALLLLLTSWAAHVRKRRRNTAADETMIYKEG